EDPVGLEYSGKLVLKPGPWSQGPVFLQQLALLKQFDITEMSSRSPEFIHLVTEVSKLAFADREAYYGDPGFVEVDLDFLLSNEYNASRATLISENADVGPLRPGAIPGSVIVESPRVDNIDSGAVGIGEPTFGDIGDNGDT